MAIKFATNVPQTLCFPYGDFREVNGTYGLQYLYTVEVDGQRDKLYATPTLHDQLQAAGVSPDAILTITKVKGEGNRKNWLIQQNGNLPSEAEPSEASGVGRSAKEGPPPPDFATLDQLMSLCLRAAQNAWQGIGDDMEVTSDDIRRTALSLFIECSRRGIHPQPTEDAGTADATTNEDDLPF